MNISAERPVADALQAKKFSTIFPHCRYKVEGIMENHIRSKTNKIYYKIIKSIGSNSHSQQAIKLVDRRVVSRYHASSTAK